MTQPALEDLLASITTKIDAIKPTIGTVTFTAPMQVTVWGAIPRVITEGYYTSTDALVYLHKLSGSPNTPLYIGLFILQADLMYDGIRNKYARPLKRGEITIEQAAAQVFEEWKNEAT